MDESVALVTDVDPLLHFFPAEAFFEPFIAMAGFRDEVMKGQAFISATQTACFKRFFTFHHIKIGIEVFSCLKSRPSSFWNGPQSFGMSSACAQLGLKLTCLAIHPMKGGDKISSKKCEDRNFRRLEGKNVPELRRIFAWL